MRSMQFPANGIAVILCLMVALFIAVRLLTNIWGNDSND